MSEFEAIDSKVRGSFARQSMMQTLGVRLIALERGRVDRKSVV